MLNQEKSLRFIMVEDLKTLTINIPTRPPDFLVEIWVRISKHLRKEDIFRLSLTNHRFYILLTSNDIWYPRIKNTWFLCDYNDLEMTHKRRMKMNETYFQYFQRKKRDDAFVIGLISDILNFGGTQDESDSIESRMEEVYKNFKKYLPCLLNMTYHITTSLFRSSRNCILLYDFNSWQYNRSSKLDTIYTASKIIENCQLYDMLKFVAGIESNPPKDLESLFVKLSCFDTSYYELIFQRQSTIKSTVASYKEWHEKNLDSSVQRKIVTLNALLHAVIRSKRKRLDKFDTFISPDPTYEDASILRFYSGDYVTSIPIVVNSIVEKLANMVGLGEFIEINENCIKITENGENSYLLVGTNQAHLKAEHLVPEILRKFPMVDLRSGPGKNESERLKHIYLGKIFTHFTDKENRTDGMYGWNRLFDFNDNGEVVLAVNRNQYLQGQILGCAGEVKLDQYNLMKKILFKRDAQYITNRQDIFNLPIYNMLKYENVKSFKQLYLKNIPLINNKGYHEKDIYWKSDNLSIGDVVWSTFLNTYGVIVKLEEGALLSTDSLQEQSSHQHEVFSLKGIRYESVNPIDFYVYCGSYGTLICRSKSLVKREHQHIESLLMYDQLGEWFSSYDYNAKKFIYRHGKYLQ